jgi:putative aldouronate transport system permease protein
MIENKRAKIIQNSIIHTIFIIFSFLCIIPLVVIASVSLSEEGNLNTFGYTLIPKVFTLSAYKFVFSNPDQIITAYFISIMRTVVGSLVSLMVISLLAFPLSRSDFKFKKTLSFYVFFTMLFNGGLVPWYILVTRYLDMKNTFFVLFVPFLVIPWFVLLLRSFFKQIPMSLYESAKIDGASEYTVFFRILLPLAKPALATVGLFICLNYWNDWWLPLLYIDVDNLVPLPAMLSRMMSNITYLTTQNTNTFMTIDLSNIPKESARMAMCLLAAGPMLFIFPFFQKYFVRGLTAGSMKG